MKRFYKEATAGTAPGGAVVRLDGKTLRTPMGAALILPTMDMAAALAAEWSSQEGEVRPASMPLNALANTMIDKVTDAGHREEITRAMCRYGASDLTCYLATHPADLVRRQTEAWEPLRNALEAHAGVRLIPVSGIRYAEQPSESMSALHAHVMGLDPGTLTAAQFVASVTGSVVIALNLAHGWIQVETAQAAAFVDEFYQMEKWGHDSEAARRIAAVQNHINDAVRFLSLLKSSG